MPDQPPAAGEELVQHKSDPATSEAPPAAAAEQARGVKVGERIDLDTVTQHRTQTDNTSVLAHTHRGERVLVGYLERHSNRRWQAYTPWVKRASPRRTKSDALPRLVESHQ